MNNIRRHCGIWAQRTFAEMLNDLEDIDPNIKRVTSRCLKRLGLLNKKVNGYACEKLPKTEEGHTGVDINYTDVFHALYSKRDFTPVSYLVELIRRYMEQEGKTNRLDGFVARGIRTFTSLIREPDFAESLLQCLSSSRVSPKVLLHARQDAKDHTDILLTYLSKEYRIWLFQFSNRGLPHDIERVTGRRGELPQGIHVLCPLKTVYAVDYDWFVKKLAKTKNRIQEISRDLESCSKAAHKTRGRLKERLQTLKTELNEYEQEFREVSKIAASELDIVEGWYFYSDAHVKRIAELIREGEKPHKYEQVVDILLAPERFLSEARMFEKAN